MKVPFGSDEYYPYYFIVDSDSVMFDYYIEMIPDELKDFKATMKKFVYWQEEIKKRSKDD